ncbi:MAG: 30S ribosomal protein S17 [Archaeoglobus sp.]|jgi:small subunit ribosomal protein S17|nr:MAG: 30S ribosomal protein S17 [Archaeoglobus sp.]
MRDIGLDVKPPEVECDDKNCPFHGVLPVRGQVFRGKVVKTYEKSAIIEREMLRYVPKYERYLKKRSKLHAHNPRCINAKPGDFVLVAECRPISKTKSFVIVEKIKEAEEI